MHLDVCVGWARKSLRVARQACGIMLIFAVLGGTAFGAPALPTGAPEVDPGSIGSALALVTGGALLMRDWFRRR